MKIPEIVLIFVISAVVCDESDQESMSLDPNPMRIPGYPPSYPPSYPENKPGYPISPPVVPVYPPSYPENKPGYPVSPPVVPVYPPSYPENWPGYPVSESAIPVPQPSYPVSESSYPGHPPSYPESEPENIYQINYWRLFFEGPQTFAVTPAGMTNLAIYIEHTCNAENLTGIVANSTSYTSKTCNGPVATIGARNFTTNGGAGYIYIDKLYTRQTNMNGNTIEGVFGQVVAANPAICTGTYYLRITIWRANDQLECTNNGLTGQVALYSVNYFYGGCQASCYLKTGIITFSPTISVTGAGPAKQLP